MPSKPNDETHETGPPDPAAAAWVSIAVVVPTLASRPTAREVLHASLARSVANLSAELSSSGADMDAEAIHRARIAIRKLRGDLRTFARLFDPDRLGDLRARLAGLDEHLSAVRDDDIRVTQLRALQVTPDLLDAFVARRELHAATLGDVLASANNAALETDLCRLAANPPTMPAADADAARILEPILQRCWRHLERVVDALDDSDLDDSEALHRIRRLARRLRFALETAAPAFDDATMPLARRLHQLQDALGEHNDVTGLRGSLTEMARDQPSLAFAAGIANERARTLAADTAQSWRRYWKHAKRKRLRDWSR